MPDQARASIEIQGVSLAFGKKSVLNGLSLSIPATGITAIMGPNGAGKSLTLKLMAGLLTADSGNVLYSGRSEVPHGRMGFVFQRPVLLRRSVRQNLLHALNIAGLKEPERTRKLDQLLSLGGMHALADAPARRLSGGEQQRLSLLRALASSPSILFLDEPSASLDPQSTFLIEEIVRDVAASGVKVVLVTHDQGQAARLSDEVVFIHRGQHMETTPTKQYLENPKSKQAQAYLQGQLLIE